MRVAILGGGQLGRMLGLAGLPLGARFTFLEPNASPPAGPLGTLVSRPYDDPEGLKAVADGADVVTYEFENVPVDAARLLGEMVAVRPPPAALEMAQDRLVEKRGFRDVGIPTPPFHPVDGPDDVAAALAAVGTPAVLKTRRFGYDGKGQAVVSAEEEGQAFARKVGRPLIAEAFVSFERELSLIAVAGQDGERRFYPLTENHHDNGILTASFAPAGGVTPGLQRRAEAHASALLDRLDYVGVLAIELFQIRGELLANEIAPRVHNSGHWTQNGAPVCQFENHLRAVLGLPLGDTAPPGHTVMLNLIGHVPDPGPLLSVPGVALHLYDKVPRPGRKLGHVNVTASRPGQALERAHAVWMMLGRDEPLPTPYGWG